MAYQDLREYLKVLTDKGLMKWVEKEVDKDWEISCITRRVLQKKPEERFALGFKKIKGYNSSSCTYTTSIAFLFVYLRNNIIYIFYFVRSNNIF